MDFTIVKSIKNSDIPALKATKLHKAYNDVEVLGAVDLSIQTGEVVSVIGPSGSGKTTLIRLLNGLEQMKFFGGAVEKFQTKRGLQLFDQKTD